MIVLAVSTSEVRHYFKDPCLDVCTVPNLLPVFIFKNPGLYPPGRSSGKSARIISLMTNDRIGRVKLACIQAVGLNFLPDACPNSV